MRTIRAKNPSTGQPLADQAVSTLDDKCWESTNEGVGDFMLGGGVIKDEHDVSFCCFETLLKPNQHQQLRLTNRTSMVN
jgi:hypothetical protein